LETMYFEDCFAELDEPPPYGIDLDVILHPTLLNITIAMPDAASWEVKELGVRQEGFSHAGYRGSLSGLLIKVRDGVEMMRGGYPQSVQPEFDKFLSKIDSLLSERTNNTLSNEIQLHIHDPSGLTNVQFDNTDSFQQSDFIQIHYFTRTFSEYSDLGLQNQILHTISSDQQLTTAEGITTLVSNAKRIVLVSGAGISVESGIPPFRATTSSENDGVIWNTFDATKMTVQNFNNDPAVTVDWWRMKKTLLPKIKSALPNPAHNFFSLLEKKGKLHSIITQNIDSLHHRSGVSDQKIIELHGHMRSLVCSDHVTRYNPIPFGTGKCDFDVNNEAEVEAYAQTALFPICPKCSSPLRHETVMFGQPLPEGAFEDATEAVKQCDLLFIVGTSLIVKPANELPILALQSGAPLVMVNLDETQYDQYAAGVIRDPAGQFFAELTKCMMELL
jgi:NAD-dependent deacetylase